MSDLPLYSQERYPVIVTGGNNDPLAWQRLKALAVAFGWSYCATLPIRPVDRWPVGYDGFDIGTGAWKWGVPTDAYSIAIQDFLPEVDFDTLDDRTVVVCENQAELDCINHLRRLRHPHWDNLRVSTFPYGVRFRAYGTHSVMTWYDTSVMRANYPKRIPATSLLPRLPREKLVSEASTFMSSESYRDVSVRIRTRDELNQLRKLASDMGWLIPKSDLVLPVSYDLANDWVRPLGTNDLPWSEFKPIIPLTQVTPATIIQCDNQAQVERLSELLNRAGKISWRLPRRVNPCRFPYGVRPDTEYSHGPMSEFLANYPDARNRTVHVTDLFPRNPKQPQEPSVAETETTAPKNTLNLEQFRRLHAAACSTWQKKIREKLGTKLLLDDEITVPADFIKSLRAAALKASQRELLDELFGPEYTYPPEGTPCIVFMTHAWRLGMSLGNGAFMSPDGQTLHSAVYIPVTIYQEDVDAMLPKLRESHQLPTGMKLSRRWTSLNGGSGLWVPGLNP